MYIYIYVRIYLATYIHTYTVYHVRYKTHHIISIYDYHLFCRILMLGCYQNQMNDLKKQTSDYEWN